MNKPVRGLLVCVAISATVAMFLLSCSEADHSERIEQHKRLAGELQSNRLFRAAIAEYEKALSFDDLDNFQRANINYLIARTYYSDLKDYKHAAAYYLRAREYDPQGSFMAEASRNLVASLEKLGNVLDAKRQLESATNIDNAPANDDDVAVAKIGSRTIWLSEIEHQILALPPEVQKRFLGSAARVEFMHQYVGVELLYAAAIREDYLSDPDIQRQREQMLKRLVVDRFVVDKVIPQIPVDTLDVHNFYEANKDERYGGVSYDSVRGQVYMDYQTEKAEVAYSEYINTLVQAENVEFLDYNVK
ncbi:MAG: hypothetical protein DRP45_02555 [Candidatus Zixiibacteriota bacterium]|nr:MAG: hypothetical protein DRP45_02555 [candidate division Zixibacteria bacterium]